MAVLFPWLLCPSEEAEVGLEPFRPQVSHRRFVRGNLSASPLRTALTYPSGPCAEINGIFVILINNTKISFQKVIMRKN
jgi:hypothetical protein